MPPTDLRRVRRRPARRLDRDDARDSPRSPRPGGWSARDPAADRRATTAPPRELAERDRPSTSSDCAAAIQRDAARAATELTQPETGFPVFAFRLHQFISRGDTVYASLEPEDDALRHDPGAAVRPGRPGARRSSRSPSAASAARSTTRCARHRGQRRTDRRPAATLRHDRRRRQRRRLPLPRRATSRGRTIRRRQLDRVPDDWLEPHGDGDASQAELPEATCPQPLTVHPDGSIGDGRPAGVTWSRRRSGSACAAASPTAAARPTDFGKLLDARRRRAQSSATTILEPRGDPQPPRRRGRSTPEARKLLSFTDNRQDASLQAGHFNDFVEVGLLRSALYRAASAAGDDGPRATTSWRQRSSTRSRLPLELYAVDPDRARSRAQRRDRPGAARRARLPPLPRPRARLADHVAEPRAVRAAARSTTRRSTSSAPTRTSGTGRHRPRSPPPTPEPRASDRARVLLDFMRRELAIKVDYLDADLAGAAASSAPASASIEPWAIDEDEQLVHARVALPAAARRAARDYRGDVYVSARGGFGQYLRRPATFPHSDERLTLDDTDRVIVDLLEALRVAGLVERGRRAETSDDVPGYQLAAAGDALERRRRDARLPRSDPRSHAARGRRRARTRSSSSFYRSVAADGQGHRGARAHRPGAAATSASEREERFRDRRSCRSSSARRRWSSASTSPSSTSSTCATSRRRRRTTRSAAAAPAGAASRRSSSPTAPPGSPHDQYFFRRPDADGRRARCSRRGSTSPTRTSSAPTSTRSGSPRPASGLGTLARRGPRRSTATTRRSRCASPCASRSTNAGARSRAPRPRASGVLATHRRSSTSADWYSRRLARRGARSGAALAFDARLRPLARPLPRGASTARRRRTTIDRRRTRAPPSERERAKRLRGARPRRSSSCCAARTTSDASQSDFYSYRYFASEGFLPGYSFPRLPLSAFIPGRRGAARQATSSSRARASSRSASSVRAASSTTRARATSSTGSSCPSSDDEDNRLPTHARQALRGAAATSTRSAATTPGPTSASAAGRRSTPPIADALPAAERRDEAPRPHQLRRGGAAAPGLRAPDRRPLRRARRPAERVAHVHRCDGERAARRSTYGARGDDLADQPRLARGARTGPARASCSTPSAATGRRTSRPTSDDPDDPHEPARRERVIPYVEDRRNALLVEPAEPLDDGADGVARRRRSRRAIQVDFQLEDNELAAEPLPSRDDRRSSSSTRRPRAARACCAGSSTTRRRSRGSRATALELCHFDPDTGEDLRRAPARTRGLRGRLLRLPDELRQPARPPAARPPRDPRLLLSSLATATVEVSPASPTRDEHLERLRARCRLRRSSRRWLDFLDERGTRAADRRAAAASRRCARGPTSSTTTHDVVVFVDGPPHDYPRRRRSATAGAAAARGRSAARSSASATTSDVGRRRRRQYPSVFGEGDVTLRGRLARPGARPRVGRPARLRPTTCSCCGRSAAPTTRSPASCPALEPVEPATLRASPTRPTSATTAPAGCCATRCGSAFRSSAGPVPLLRRASPSSRGPTSSCRC